MLVILKVIVWLLFKVRTAVLITVQVFQKQPKLDSRKHLVAGTRVCQTRETAAISILLGCEKSFSAVHNRYPLCKGIN